MSSSTEKTLASLNAKFIEGLQNPARLDLLQVGCLDTRLPRLGLIAHGVASYKELTQARQAQSLARQFMPKKPTKILFSHGLFIVRRCLGRFIASRRDGRAGGATFLTLARAKEWVKAYTSQH